MPHLLRVLHEEQSLLCNRKDIKLAARGGIRHKVGLVVWFRNVADRAS